mmetsp:Transcript_24997/g.56390  ORF Transcript_24997/g.56390 Transcript_24997/m.56390 type:complete len:208 (+) Transcript_24997:215-838(+)
MPVLPCRIAAFLLPAASVLSGPSLRLRAVAIGSLPCKPALLAIVPSPSPASLPSLSSPATARATLLAPGVPACAPCRPPPDSQPATVFPCPSMTRPYPSSLMSSPARSRTTAMLLGAASDTRSTLGAACVFSGPLPSPSTAPALPTPLPAATAVRSSPTPPVASAASPRAPASSPAPAPGLAASTAVLPSPRSSACRVARLSAPSAP